MSGLPIVTATPMLVGRRWQWPWRIRLQIRGIERVVGRRRGRSGCIDSSSQGAATNASMAPLALRATAEAMPSF
jgi:hypothetical protein